MTSTIRNHGIILIGLLLLVVNHVALASMQVSPTQIFISAEHQAAGLTLHNNGNSSIYAQIRIFEWRQQDGEEKLVPTQSIVASPPMLELNPGVSQLVRLVRNRHSPTDKEVSYRILIDEVPIEKNKTEPTTSGGLQFRLRYSLPVFLAPPEHVNVQPILQTQLLQQDDTDLIRITNMGNGHAQVTDLMWQHNRDSITDIAPGLSGYVLPGQYQQWPLPKELNLNDGGTITARINGELDQRILIPIIEVD